MKRKWRGNIFHIQGTNRSNDLAILTGSKIIHEEMELEKTNKEKRKNIYILIIKLKISNADHTFVNCYAPNNHGQSKVLHELQDEIQETNRLY